MSAVVVKMYQDDAVISETNLRFYYEKFFPLGELIKWLTYGGTTSSLGLMRREVSFTFQKDGPEGTNDYYIRWQSFENRDKMQHALCGQAAVPFKIDFGAIYNKPVSQMQMCGSDFRPVERELVFDIDMNDYDELRTCCSSKTICSKCWRWINIAVQILGDTLEQDFGFHDILWVYSGRRGIHGWVCDPKARQLSPEARHAIVDYLTLVSAGDRHLKKVNLFHCDRHPMVLRSFDVCYRHIADILQEQEIYKNPQHLTSLLLYIPPSHSNIATFIKQQAQHPSNVNSLKLFETICNLLEISTPREYVKRPQNSVDSFPTFMRELVISICYPRLDAMVSREMGHLLKSPFCIHAKTGRVCVPLTTSQIAHFKPEQVPTLLALKAFYDENGGGFCIAKNDITGNLQDSPLETYLTHFQEKFISTCLIHSNHQKRSVGQTGANLVQQ